MDEIAGAFDGWGDTLKDIVSFAARSKIDAEYNAPTRLAERQMQLQAQDGSLYTAGDVATGKAKNLAMPLAIGLGAVLVLVLVLKK
jgi:hypothetical protein